MRVRKYKSITSLKACWDNLYSNNTHLSFFQPYNWNLSLEKAMKSALLSIFKHSLLYYVFDERIIFPLVISRKDKIIFLLGRGYPSDYLSFIYSNISYADTKEIIMFLQERYKKYTILLDRINESNPLKDFLERLSKEFNQKSNIQGKCVHISTCMESGSYYESLSKHARQNYRTAVNRLTKDGFSYDLHIKHDIINKDLGDKLFELYKTRRNDCDNILFIQKMKKT